MTIGKAVAFAFGYSVCPVTEDDPDNPSMPRIIGYVLLTPEGDEIPFGDLGSAWEEFFRIVDELVQELKLKSEPPAQNPQPLGI